MLNDVLCQSFFVVVAEPFSKPLSTNNNNTETYGNSASTFDVKQSSPSLLNWRECWQQFSLIDFDRLYLGFSYSEYVGSVIYKVLLLLQGRKSVMLQKFVVGRKLVSWAVERLMCFMFRGRVVGLRCIQVGSQYVSYCTLCGMTSCQARILYFWCCYTLELKDVLCYAKVVVIENKLICKRAF